MAALDVFAGDTKKIVVSIKDANGNSVDIANLQSAKFSIVEAPSGRANYNATPKFVKTISDGITVLDDANGVLQIILVSADTQALVGDYYYELEIIDSGGDVTTVLSDLMKIRPTIIPNPVG